MKQLFAMTRHRALFHTLVLSASILGLCLSATANQPTIVTFDPPGSIFTVVYQINPSGTIIGVYQDTGGVYHAFMRDPNGKITSYDVPGAGKGPFQGTAFVSINPSGTVVGQYIDSNNVYHVFRLRPQGAVTKFDAPNAGTGTGQGTFGYNINPSGEIAGQYGNTGNGFLGTLLIHGLVMARSQNTMPRERAQALDKGPDPVSEIA